MHFKKKIKFLVFIILISIIIIPIELINNNGIKIKIQLNTENEIIGQLYYTSNQSTFMQYFSDTSEIQRGFNEKQSVQQKITNGILEFEIPTNNVKLMRIDFGSNPGKIVVNKITIYDKLKQIDLKGNEISSVFDKRKNMELVEQAEDRIELFSDNKDPSASMNDKINYKELLEQRGHYNIWLIIRAGIISTFITLAIYYLLRQRKYKRDIDNIKALYIVVILFIMCIPYIANKLGINIIGNTEQRTIKKEPTYTINISKLDEYIKIYEEYFNDSFGFRDTLVWTNSYLNKTLFNKSELEKVTIGENGWLFYAGEGKNAELQQRGVKVYSEIDLQKILRNLEEKQKYLKAQGSKFILFIPPDKETIYEEFLPKNIKKVTDKTKLDQVIEYVRKNSDIRIVDVRDTFKNLKDYNLLYYKTDTHWNKYGAYLAYLELMKEIRTYVNTTEAHPLEDFIIDKYSFDNGGDIANMLGLNKKYQEEYIQFTLKEGSKVPVTNYGINNAVVTAKNNDNTLPKLVMFRDSFASNLGPFLSEHFSTAAYKWDYKMDSKLIQQYNPDVVILEIVERSIDQILSDNPKEIR